MYIAVTELLKGEGGYDSADKSLLSFDIGEDPYHKYDGSFINFSTVVLQIFFTFGYIKMGGLR